MATFQNTLTIQRPVDDVFAFLADFENIPTWNYAIVATKKTSPGPVGVGTTYRQLRSIPARSEEGFEVTAFEPTTRLEVHGDIGPFTATISYLLAPSGDGTQLTNVIDLESASGAVRLLAPLAASRVKAAVAANLNTLKRMLEAERQGAPG
jgi:carbon monoxide dehydrogenase subunit G